MFKLSLFILISFFAKKDFAQAAPEACYQLKASFNSEGTSARYSLSRASKGATCGSSSSSPFCQDVELQLPDRCGWECKDGILSGQGTTIIKGSFAKPEEGHKPRFQVSSAFDTWRASPLSSPLLKISGSDAVCSEDACSGHFLMENLLTGKTSSLLQLSFDQADDINYKLDASRAIPSLLSRDGLLVTGRVRSQKLTARLVFRPWITEAACDPLATLKKQILPAESADFLFAILQNEAEAAQSSDGRSLYWAIVLEEDSQQIQYRTGINDLWASELSIDKKSCAISVLAEH